MPYHIDEENSELAFEVREGNKLVIKIKSNIFSDSLELYLIKVGDNTEPTDKNVFSSLRVLKEIENLHDTILKEINSVTSGFWELKQDSQGNEYIATKYNVLTEGGLTTYGLGEQKLGTIYDGLPIDNDTIYWEEVEGSRVLKAKGSGGEAGSVQWGNISGKPTWIEDTKPTYNWYEIQGEKPFYTKEEVASKYVTIDTEQEITALKHFTAGLSVGESKKKIYEENGVVYIDADVAVTGAMTFYASAGRTVSTIMDAVTVDGITIKKENNVLKAVSGAGSSFDENAMWSALSGSSDNQINKSHLTTALDGYATRNWVIENYATKSELSAVSNKLNDFLEGSDTDNIINKWKELEAFLSGMAETDNLAEILKTKADRSYVDSTFVTLSTKQTITGEKTFSSVLNTAAIKASGEITTPSLAASDYVTIAGIKLRKLEDGALMLEGNLALTGALTMYATGAQGFDTIYDGLPIDNDTIYWQEVDGSRVLKAREGSGSSFDKSDMWTALAGSTTEQINKSHLTAALTGYATESWVTSKNYLTSVSIATISDLHANWDALLKAAPSAYVTRWPTMSEVTGKQNLIVKLNGGTTEGTNQFTYNVTGAKTINITPAGIGTYTKSESDSKYPTKTGSGASGTWGINISGTADRLVNKGNVTAIGGTTTFGEGLYLHKVYNNGYPCSYGNLLRIGGAGLGELVAEWAGSSATGHLFYRSKRDTSTQAWSDWKKVAFVDDNVASASKLTTSSTNDINSPNWEEYKATIQNFPSGSVGAPPVGDNVNAVLNIPMSKHGTSAMYGYQLAFCTQREEIYARKFSAGSIGSWYGIPMVVSGVLKKGFSSVECTDWFRSKGSTGWYSEDFGGGWYMTDSTYIRTFNNKAIVAIRYDADQGLPGSSWHNGQGAFSVRIHNNENQTPLLLAYRYDTADTGANRLFALELLNTGGQINFSMAGSTRMSINKDTNTVTFSGNILAVGGITQYSDQRAKTIIEQITLPLKDIANSPAVRFKWNDWKQKDDGKTHIGGIAQYVQRILPEAIYNSDGALTMDYATTGYIFAVNTAKHLLNFETKTDREIKKLKQQVKYLEKQLKKLGYEEVRTLDDQSV